MAGKIVADTLEHSTAGSVTTDYVVNGSAKSWVEFDGTAATPSPSDSLNVASITDNGTGTFSANYSNAMGTANYAAVVSGGQYHNGTDASNSTSNFRLDHFGSSHTFSDPSSSTGAVFGDLA